MGYSTYFTGKFTCTPALIKPQIDYLNAFSESRRMGRYTIKLNEIPKGKALRKAVGLPLGKEGEYTVWPDGDFGQSSNSGVIDLNNPPKSQPGLWCQWIPTDDGTVIHWDGNEKFYYYNEWLIYIINNFLKVWGVVLNGMVTWEGEDKTDTGIIYVSDNVVSIKHKSNAYSKNR